MTTTERAETAARLLKTTEPGHLGRAFDDCFEAGDGGDVKRHLFARARRDPELVTALYAHNLPRWVSSALAETTPTSGEWIVRHLNTSADVERINADGSALLVAAVYGGDSWPANARLIAAAPDLLEACWDALNALCKGGAMDDTDIHAAEALRAAIAKAGGE